MSQNCRSAAMAHLKLIQGMLRIGQVVSPTNAANVNVRGSEWHIARGYVTSHVISRLECN
jgi:hypothetical protein